MTVSLILTLLGWDESQYTYAIVTNLSAIECETAHAKHEKLLLQSFQAGDFILTCESNDNHEG
jgi:hypothetical protein